MRPCAAACLRGHTAWLGLAAWFEGGFPWVQSRRALAHLSRRRREIRRSGALDGLVRKAWPAPCAHALRASACATAEGAGGASARSQRAHIAHLWDVDGEEAAGSHAWAATRSACSRRARSGAACWQRGGMSGRIPHGRWRAGGGLGAMLGARRGVGGDARGPWPCHWHARITQRRRVGELEPELYCLAVGGQFHDLVKRMKNRRRASRARSGGAPGRAHPVGNARRACRGRGRLARGVAKGAVSRK